MPRHTPGIPSYNSNRFHYNYNRFAATEDNVKEITKKRDCESGDLQLPDWQAYDTYHLLL